MKNITLIPLTGTEKIAVEIQRYIQRLSEEAVCEILEVELPRFTTGDAKAVLSNSVRGRDVFILTDVGNHNCKYTIFGEENKMSPDEHFQNLIRTISSIGGKALRVNVIMPLMYAARQDKRGVRESLDCAVALQQLYNIGVENIMTIDVHDERVQNAVPFMGFDNLMPTYQMIKTICRNYPDMQFDEKHMVMVSPDFGGMNRNYIYANELGIDMGVFYKRRNLEEVKDGKNEIMMHKFIGPSLEEKDVLLIDDIIASGETILDSVKTLKNLGAKRVFVGVSFGFFTEGVEKFANAYKEGLFDAIFVSNASYVKEEVSSQEWFREVNIRKYIAYYIYCVNSGISISQILNPHLKIEKLMERYKEYNGHI